MQLAPGDQLVLFTDGITEAAKADGEQFGEEGLIVEVCGVRCLEIAEGIAALLRPDACGSEERCIMECRDDAIHMAWVPFEGHEAVGDWR